MENYSIANIIFEPGASGTFVSHMISVGIMDPWYTKYHPLYENENYELVNEYINPHMNIIRVWHPYSLKTNDILNKHNNKWINLTCSNSQNHFNEIINYVKRYNKDSTFDKNTIIDYIENFDYTNYKINLLMN